MIFGAPRFDRPSFTFLKRARLASITPLIFHSQRSLLSCSDQLRPFEQNQSAQPASCRMLQATDDPFQGPQHPCIRSRCLLPNQPNCQRSVCNSLPRGEHSVLRLSPTEGKYKFRTFCCAERCSWPWPASCFLRPKPTAVNHKSASVSASPLAGRPSRSVTCERRNHRHF